MFLAWSGLQQEWSVDHMEMQTLTKVLRELHRFSIVLNGNGSRETGPF